MEKTRLNQVGLTVNNLTNISKTSIQVGKIVGYFQRPFFSLGGNPLLCDCQMQWLKKVNNENLNSEGMYPIIGDLESIYCRLTQAAENTFIPLVDAGDEGFLCTYETHCFLSASAVSLIAVIVK